MDPSFDYENGNIIFPTSGNMAMNMDGNLMMRMGDNMVMDMDSGELHITSSWRDSAHNSFDEDEI